MESGWVHQLERPGSGSSMMELWEVEGGAPHLQLSQGAVAPPTSSSLLCSLFDPMQVIHLGPAHIDDPCVGPYPSYAGHV